MAGRSPLDLLEAMRSWRSWSSPWMPRGRASGLIRATAPRQAGGVVSTSIPRGRVSNPGVWGVFASAHFDTGAADPPCASRSFSSFSLKIVIPPVVDDPSILRPTGPLQCGFSANGRRYPLWGRTRVAIPSSERTGCLAQFGQVRWHSTGAPNSSVNAPSQSRACLISSRCVPAAADSGDDLRGRVVGREDGC